MTADAAVVDGPEDLRIPAETSRWRIPSPLRSARTAALIVAALAVFGFVNSLDNEFAYDDVHVITNREGIGDLSRLPEALFEPYWQGPYGQELGLWRPVMTGLFMLEWAVDGSNGVVFHLVNVVAHGVASALVVLLLANLMPVAAAFAGGVLFALHPVHVEAVSNVVGGADVISTALVLGALLLLTRPGDGFRASWPRAVGAGFLYLIAFGTKEGAVTLPGLLFLVDAARSRIGFRELPRYVRERALVYGVLLAVAVLMLVVRFQILGSIAKPFGPLGAGLLTEVPRIWTLAEIWTHYVRLLVFPMDLSADYSPNVIPIGLGWHGANITGAIVTLALLASSLVAWRRRAMAPDVLTPRAAAFGVVWFGIAISPVSNVFFIAGVTLAERTMYLPSVGFVAAIGWLLVRMSADRPRGAWIALLLMAALMGWKTWDRTPTWKDNEVMFNTMISDYPHSGRSQWVLSGLFFQQGQYEEGMRAFRAAVGLLRAEYQLMTEIGRRLTVDEHYDAAQRILEYAYRDHPEFATAPGQIAVLRSEQGDPEGTEHWARLAVERQPTDPVSNHLLAWALTELGRYDEAVVARRAAIDAGEANYWQQWHSLAQLEANRGDTTAAREALDSAKAKAVTESAREYLDTLSVLSLKIPVGDTTGAAP